MGRAQVYVGLHKACHCMLSVLRSSSRQLFCILADRQCIHNTCPAGMVHQTTTSKRFMTALRRPSPDTQRWAGRRSTAAAPLRKMVQCTRSRECRLTSAYLTRMRHTGAIHGRAPGQLAGSARALPVDHLQTGELALLNGVGGMSLTARRHSQHYIRHGHSALLNTA
jgi:hypothetical protein